ncbi:MAG: S8 family serine peptidase [Saprospiraceae bacterium]|nr:S8 family serine peptidase [Saprospiraceae bacterium]
MKKSNIFKFTLTLGVLFAFALGCNKESALESSFGPEELFSKLVIPAKNAIPGQYIVIFEGSALPLSFRAESLPYDEGQGLMRGEALKLLSRHAISDSKLGFVYAHSVQGFSLKELTDAELQKLLADPNVKYVEQDQNIQIEGGPPGGGGSCAGNSSETTPCGISLVNGGANYTGSRKAYVLDTGIDLDHPDLNVATYGFNGTTESGLDDGNGHGSHVAGTIAAIGGNGIGVKGVAAGALVVPVKVLNKRGSGTNSGVIAGVDYVGANGTPGDVANMSLGGGVSSALDNAVVNASSDGTWFVVAAGNSSADANNYSPARANGAYVRTIAAMTCSGAWASYSNFGIPPIDWIAPGSSICSTYKSGGYASLSGTSMATPHAAGVILVRGGSPNSCGTVSHSSGSYARICI